MTMCITNSCGGYPLGADEDPKAPWHEKEEEPEKVAVKTFVSVTYSKSVTVIVNKGYTNKDLKDAVEEANLLPNDILREHLEELEEELESNDWLTKYDLTSLQENINRHVPWHEDELEVFAE